MQWTLLQFKPSDRVQEMEVGWLAPTDPNNPFTVMLANGPPRRLIMRSYQYPSSMNRVLSQVEAEVAKKGGSQKSGKVGVGPRIEQFVGLGWSILISEGAYRLDAGRMDMTYVTVTTTTYWDENPVGKGRRLVRSWLPQKAKP